jgi:prepilin-type N-terminal cleavage/methylation domain-containing protein
MPCDSPLPTTPTTRRRRDSRGFSLVELMVVILIIGLLGAILIPVISKMKQSAYKTDTTAQLNVISMACQSYYSTFKSYPGLFSDQDIYSHTQWNRQDRIGIPSGITHSGDNYVTGTENLVLSLMGGVRLDIKSASDTDPNAIYDDTIIENGKGVSNLNLRSPKNLAIFLENGEKMLPSGWKGMGNFTDTGGNVAKDTNLPELVDRYSEPLPILYLRARVGAPGIIGKPGSPPYQYDIRQIAGYTQLGTSPGLDFPGKGDHKATAAESDKNNGANGADAINYLKAPGAPMPSSFNPTNQVGATPRSKDSFILISAGADRIYGTLDDITSFGSIE